MVGPSVHSTDVHRAKSKRPRGSRSPGPKQLYTVLLIQESPSRAFSFVICPHVAYHTAEPSTTLYSFCFGDPLGGQQGDPNSVATVIQFVTFITLQMQALSSVGHRLNPHGETSFGDSDFINISCMNILEIATNASLL